MKNKAWWIAAAILVAIILPSLLHRNSLHTLVTLLTGWITFLSENARRMEADPASLLTFAIVLIGFGIAAQFCGAMIYESIKEKQGQPAKWRVRWTLAIASASILLFCAGMAGVGLFSHLAWIATAEDRSILHGYYTPFGSHVYALYYKATDEKWATERVLREAQKSTVQSAGKHPIRIVLDANGEWRAMVGYDVSTNHIVGRWSMTILPRNDDDRDALQKLQTLEDIFDFYQRKK